jgi:hypothetical protein
MGWQGHPTLPAAGPAIPARGPAERLTSSVIAERDRLGIPLPEPDLQRLVDRWGAAERELEAVNAAWTELHARDDYPPQEAREALNNRQRAANVEHQQAVAALLRAAR